ncbi:RBBP9/YdeN family alpha/beta hydrolase [Comamonas endophytica]|uniref:Alpha/beta hydrolase n=2 Tax=Comamonas endophytica TaxID=2949090 RepID=A0ABY6GDK7_9BURK|nr:MULTISPECIES: alpha/beta hydrolase [unclassified Acidovorax]MCD2512453.1 alpha/beta hydrolase [Acidovorax sp. D4N7]UYG53176.1 alpha/beta hydrolase [Acidovorax sp. 5MLIR]
MPQTSSSTPQVWLLPDGGPQARAEPWLAHWQAQGHRQLEQHDWQRPLRGDWSARLQETLVDAEAPVVLVASGLGCILTAWWAAHSPAAAKVRGALLIAPTDVEDPALREQLPGWAPIALKPLPFPCLVIGRKPPAGCSLERAQALAHAWGAPFAVLDDPAPDAGEALLQSLLKD